MADEENIKPFDEVNDLLTQLKNDQLLNDDVDTSNLQDDDPIELPEVDENDIGKFILEHSGKLIKDSIEVINTVKKDTLTSQDPERMEGLASLINASTKAIESLNKVYLQNKKSQTVKEIKQLEHEQRKELHSLKAAETNNDEDKSSHSLNSVKATRDEIMKRLTSRLEKATIVNADFLEES